MSTFNTDLDLNSLALKYGTDKGSTFADGQIPGHFYSYIYQKHLQSIRHQPLTLLEIGVYGGASIKMWREYLPNARIIGVDINPECARYDGDGVKVYIGDATDPAFFDDVVFKHEGGAFDVIIDDGSHKNNDIIRTLVKLFPHLNNGGLYFIEDIAVTAVSPEHIAPYEGFSNFFEFIHMLIHHLNFGGNADGRFFVPGDNRIRKLFLDSRMNGLSMWNQLLFSVQLYTNMCVLEKQERIRPYR